MPVMTRKASAQDMELKLRTALKELETSNQQCQQLLQERDDNEEEVKKIIDKNSSLKRELVDLHRQFLNVVDERDQLRMVTDSFSNCSNLYEEALCKVRDLEDELTQANLQILKLQKQKECSQINETNHLYNELVNSNCHPHSLITIDLTEDSLLKPRCSYKVSQNKLKKYARLNKIIKRCNKFKKQQKLYSKNTELRKERVALVNKLSNYQIKLEDSKNIYEIDTQRLQAEIQDLNDSLKSLYNKYVTSQNQIKEHILAANELVDMCTYNAGRVDTLTLSNPQCTCQRESEPVSLQPEISDDPSQHVIVQECIPSQDIPEQEVPCTVSLSSLGSGSAGHSVMFSDSIGRGLGKLLSYNLSYNTQNFCTPGLGYKQIMQSITRHEYNPYTNITVFIGNSLKVKKEDITDCVTDLLNINCNKIILCAFPYFDHLSKRQNNYIHRLNKQIHFLVSHYSDKLVYFDTNIFVEKLMSTRGTVYLPISFRQQIARLLAYIIKSDITSMSKSPVIVSTIFSSNTNVNVTNTSSLN